MSSIHEQLEALKIKADKCNEHRIRINAEIEHAEAELEKLKSLAKEKYGTDDIEKLAGILENMEQENTKKLTAYEANINTAAAEITDKHNKLQAIKAS